MEYRKCFVPTCSNNSNNSPNKIFVRIREDLREKWCRDVGAEYYKIYTMYCCEDHFDPKKDLKNYHQHKLMKQEPRLKPTASLCNIAPNKSEDSPELAKLLLQHVTTHTPVKRRYEETLMPSTSSYSTTPVKLPQKAVICQDCFLRLDQHCSNGNVNARRDLGHTHICLGCGRSVAETSRRVRYHTVEVSDPLIATILSWDIHNEVMSRYAFVCHTCWMRANWKLSRDVSRKQPAADEHAGLVSQSADPEQLPVPHQETPVHPSKEQPVPVKPTESRAYIILPHYKHAANTSRQCFFEGCANQSRHLIPMLIKVMKLKPLW